MDGEAAGAVAQALTLARHRSCTGRPGARGNAAALAGLLQWAPGTIALDVSRCAVASLATLSLANDSELVIKGSLK